MEAVLTLKTKEKAKRNIVRCALGVFLSAGMVCCNMLWAGGMTVYASEQTLDALLGGAVPDNPDTMQGPFGDIFSLPAEGDAGGIYSARAAAQGSLDLSQGVNAGDLAADGYQWDAGSNVLKLKDAVIGGTVTLPDATVTIETEGNCSIDTLAIAGGSPDSTNLTFSGTGRLTVGGRINISGSNYNTLTVAAGAYLAANGGIVIGTSGGTDSVVTVKGTLTAEGGGFYALSAGSVVVGAGGLLKVSGGDGVLLNGRSSGDFTAVFTVERGGCFEADCGSHNVLVVAGGGTFPSGSNAEGALSIPDGYLPDDCRVELNQAGGEVNLVKISTGQVYNGPMVIHENHSWSEEWKKDGTHHWKECTYAGCNKKKEYAAHSYDNDTGTCICGSTLVLTLNSTEEQVRELVYDGQEKKPGVTVTLDGVVLDASDYKISYSNNINAGEALITVTGTGGFTFEGTRKFQIAKAKPAVAWDKAEQTVAYSGRPAVIVPPVVTLVNEEKFDGDITYSYAKEGSDSYIPGLPVKAGIYTVRASIPEQGNYTAADSTNTLRLTVERAESATNVPSGSRSADAGNKSPKTGQTSAPWQTAAAGTLAVIMGAGGLLAARRKKES